MTPQEAIAELEKDLKHLKDALCIHVDEFGTYCADEDAVNRMQEIVDTLGGFVEHQIDFVATWLCMNAEEYEDSADGSYGEVLSAAWREEMAQ